jgi:hypothetical protein
LAFVAAINPNFSCAGTAAFRTTWRRSDRVGVHSISVGEIEPQDLSGNLVVQLGVATEDLNRRWYQANTGQVLTDVQHQIRHPVLRWMAATLDGPC